VIGNGQDSDPHTANVYAALRATWIRRLPERGTESGFERQLADQPAAVGSIVSVFAEGVGPTEHAGGGRQYHHLSIAGPAVAGEGLVPA
jgi:hypothetical protein